MGVHLHSLKFTLSLSDTNSHNEDKYTHLSIYLSIYLVLVGRVFTNCPGKWSSIPGRVIPKPQKMRRCLLS